MAGLWWMPKTVKLLRKTVADSMDIVHDLRAQGYVQGQDFDFAYHPTVYHKDGFSVVTPKTTEFTFYNDVLATWFYMKYS